MLSRDSCELFVGAVRELRELMGFRVLKTETSNTAVLSQYYCEKLILNIFDSFYGKMTHCIITIQVELSNITEAITSFFLLLFL